MKGVIEQPRRFKRTLPALSRHEIFDRGGHLGQCRAGCGEFASWNESV